MANSKLSSFIRQTFLIEREDAGPCVKIVLKHVNANAKQNEVHTFDCKAAALAIEDKKEAFIDALIDEIENKAQEDAEAIGGHQRYIVFPYFKGQAKPLGRCVFAIDAGDSEDDDGDSLSGTEPPTKTGLVAQLMRHNEAMMRSTVMISTQLMNTMRASMQQAQDHNEKLMTDKMQTFDLIEQLQSRRQERELMGRKAEFEEKIKEEAFSKLMLIAPSMFNRVMGKKMLPEPTTPMEMTLKQLASSFNQEQMNALVSSGILSSEQMIAIVNLFQSVLSEQPKEDIPEAHPMHNGETKPSA